MDSLRFFKMISEPLRLRLLALIRQTPLTVSELVEILELSQSNISHHLKLLTDNGFLQPQKSGNMTLYRIALRDQLPGPVKPVWTEMETVFSEIPETRDDQLRLASVLAGRKQRGFPEDWTSWRLAQPDLPYTFELAFLGKEKRGTVVDIGCGDGRFLKEIRSSFDEAIGIDNDPEQLRRAESQNPDSSGIRFMLADAARLPVADELAQSVYFRMVLQFLSDAQPALTEAVRILAPGGRVAIIDRHNGEESALDLSQDFFNSFCSAQKGLKLVNFRRYPQIFVAVLEKS